MSAAHRSTREGLTEWQRLLDDHGLWLAAWPEEYGGSNLSPAQLQILDKVLRQVQAPVTDIQANNMIGPIIYTFGSTEQKERYLPAIKRTNIWWCQGFSEPGAGSDLFALTSKAERQGDKYLVNGRKIWTSRAHWADMMFAILRTPTGEVQGDDFSFMLIDMRAPGVTIRPIYSIDNNHHLNEVLLENVEVPRENLIGEEGQGREITKHLLALERLSLGVIEETKARTKQIEELLNDIEADQNSDFDQIERSLNELRISVAMLEGLIAGDHGADHKIAASIKVLSTEVEQTSSELLMRTFAHASLEQGCSEDGLRINAVQPPGVLAMSDYLFLRAASIYGGSNEVQRNILFRMLSK